MSRDYEYESALTASRAEIAAVLSGVLDGVHAGSIRVNDGTETVTVTTPDEFDLELGVEITDGEVSLELEVTGTVPDDEEPDFAPSERQPETRNGPSASVDGTDASRSLARFELFRDSGEEWRWRLRHRNGNIIATSGEGYTRKHNARKGLRSVIENAPQAEVTEDSTD